MNQERQPLVSIGMPTFNRAGTLRRAIESVLAQDYPNLELVISDNASTDGTQELCESFARADQRIRFHRQPENRGAMANFQEVLDRATGEFFMWLADDDWIDPSYISTCTGVLLRDPESVLVAGRAAYYEGGRQLFVEPPLVLESEDPRARVFAYFRRVSTNGIFYGVMRRSVLRAVPIRQGLAADWLLIASLAFCGKLRTVREVMVHRSIQGVSRDMARLAAAFGLPRVYRRNPHLYLSLSAFRDIGWESPVYRPLGTAARHLLALRVLALMILRFNLWGPLRRLQARLGALPASVGGAPGGAPHPGKANR